MKYILSLIGLVLALASCVAANDEFFIGQWCGPYKVTQEQYSELANANFNVAFIGGRPKEEIIKALDLCKANGIKGMVIDPRIWSQDRDRKKLTSDLDGVVKDFSGHEALWGYYVKDEPSGSLFPKLAEVNKYLIARDPKHIPFMNLLPTYAPSSWFAQPSYEQYIDAFCKTVKPRLLSYDHYSLMTNGSVRSDYFMNLEIIRRQSVKHEVPFNLILLSVPHGPFKDPCEADLRWQVYTALAYGARGIMYFTYTTPNDAKWGFHDAIIDKDGKRTAKYEWVKQINGEVKKLAPTLMHLNSVAVYHTSPVPKDAKALPYTGLISNVEGGEFVIGQFISDNGARYAMFVNRNLKSTANAKITFSQRVNLYELDPNSGKENKAATRNENGDCVWRAAFSPGQGQLVRIDTPDNQPVINWEE